MRIRSALERGTHRIVVRRRLPHPFRGVRLFVSSEAGLRYLKPSLKIVDPMLLGLVDELVEPGHVVWDIGANIGLFTVSAAARAGMAGAVVAVEADTWNVGLLRRSAQAQRPASARIDVVPAAVARQIGLAQFRIATRNRSTNALDGFGTSQMGGERELQLVPTLTLDSLAEHFPLPDVLKIDVEGAEVEVLAAASVVLDARPTILCEVAAANASAVAELLTPYGYRYYDAEEARRPRPQVDLPPGDVLAFAGRC